MRWLHSLLVLLLFPVTACEVTTVTVEFEAQALTISGNPLGYDDTLSGTEVTGFFTYNQSSYRDTDDSPDRGVYPHLSGGAFLLDIEGSTLTGSSTPTIHIEDGGGTDTFRYIDGPRDLGDEGGVMSWNGTANEDIELWIAITDTDGSSFSSAEIPVDFPMLDPELPHTFSVSDDDGTMLMQWHTLTKGAVITE